MTYRKSALLFAMTLLMVSSGTALGTATNYLCGKTRGEYTCESSNTGGCTWYLDCDLHKNEMNAKIYLCTIDGKQTCVANGSSGCVKKLTETGCYDVIADAEGGGYSGA